MKNNKIFLFAFLILMQGTWTSCSEEWLDVDPIGKSSTGLYYSNEDEVSLALVAAYDFLSAELVANGDDTWTSATLIKALPADDSNAGGGNTGDIPGYQNLDDFIWEAQNDKITKLYQTRYYGIYRANQVINHRAEETDNIRRMVAEAKALKAYYYLDLVMCFGGVPLAPETDINPDTPLPRESADAIYDYIVQTLEETVDVLPSKSQYSAADKFRASKQMALGLLVKANMFRGNTSAAISAFERLSAFEGSEVGLVSDFANVFKESEEFGIESLFEASFVGGGYDWGNVTWVARGTGAYNQHLGHSDNRHIQLMGLRDAFGGAGNGMNAGWGFLPATDKVRLAMEDGDLRKEYTAISFDEFSAKYTETFVKVHDAENSVRMKYATWTDETSGGVVEMNYGTNWRLLRYADVLLMAAEAYNANGNDAQAQAQLNKVRSRAGLSNVTATGTALLDAIKKERFVELAFEGHRYWDLVRWGDAGTEIAQFQAGKHEVFPIPQIIIDTNQGISQADQNPGY